jgi:hypothetical protein
MKMNRMAFNRSLVAPEPETASCETAPAPPLKPPSRPRKDRARFHATKHGILARPLLEALDRRGENIRQLRKLEHALRAELQPVGAIAKLIFDRMWSSYLRCLLIDRTEARTSTPDGPPSELSFTSNFTRLPKSDFSFDDVSLLGLQRLALIQRYDAHFSRDFFRSMGLLLAMRDGGKAGLARQFQKTLGKSREDLTE